MTPPARPPAQPRLIGPAGANVMHIEETSGARLVVHESGEVALYAPTRRQFFRARDMVLEVEGHSVQTGKKWAAAAWLCGCCGWGCLPACLPGLVPRHAHTGLGAQAAGLLSQPCCTRP